MEILQLTLLLITGGCLIGYSIIFYKESKRRSIDKTLIFSGIAVIAAFLTSLMAYFS